MKPRKRTLRRAEDRAQQKLGRDLEKLAASEPGGSPAHPIVITSPSEVEVRAAAPCPICRSPLRVEEHTAEQVEGRRLRVARVVCSFCRGRRAVYFQLASERLN